jgi:hypothetical protein
MISPNEFWLQLHRLAEAYEAEGRSTGERAQNILGQYREMFPVAQREVLAALRLVAANMPDLCHFIIAAANDAKLQKETRPQDSLA